MMQPNLHVVYLHLHIPVLLDQSYFFSGDGRGVSVAQLVTLVNVYVDLVVFTRIAGTS